MKLILRFFFPLFLTLLPIALLAQFELKMTFLPQYLDTMELSVISYEKGNLIEIKTDKIHDSAWMNTAGLNEITSFFESYSLGLDTTKSILQVHVSGSYAKDGIRQKFEFNRPDRKEDEHRLIKTLWKIMYQLYKKEETITYLEKLEQQFDFGLGIKMLSDDPLTYKLYGRITAHDANTFIDFLNGIPTDRKVVFDMSNFESMGRVFYPTIRDFNSKNDQIYWINCGNAARVHLLNSGTMIDHIILKSK